MFEKNERIAPEVLCHALINDVEMGITVIDTDYNIIMANAGMSKMFNKDPKELIGKKCFKEYEKRDSAADNCSGMKSMLTGQTCSMETEEVRDDGTHFFVKNHSIPIFDKDSKIKGFIEIFEDITERKNTEKILKVSENKYRNIFLSSRDAVMTLESPLWKFTSVNSAAIKMFNAKDEDDFLSYDFLQLSPERQADGQYSSDKAKQMIEKAMSEGFNLFEWTHNQINGEEFFAEVVLSRVDEGDKSYLHALVRDITKIKQEREQLKIKNFAIEFSINSIALSGMEGKFIYANHAFLNMMGYDDISEVLGKTPVDITVDSKQTIDTMAAIDEKGSWHGTEQLKRKDGSIIDVELFASMIKDEKGKLVCVMVCFIDITERKKAEAELKIKTKELSDTNEELHHVIEELRVANEDAQKAKDLAEKKAVEFERFNNLSVGRELKMIELKKQIAELEKKLSNDLSS